MADPTAIADVAIKALALLGAAAFFGYKVISGFNNHNLSLLLSCTRSRQGQGITEPDLVICNILIEKGTTAALALEGLVVRFSWGSGNDESKVSEIEICRYLITDPSNVSGQKVTWEPDHSRPHLYLSPGEKTSFASALEIPRSKSCKVEVVAFSASKKHFSISMAWLGYRAFTSRLLRWCPVMKLTSE